MAEGNVCPLMSTPTSIANCIGDECALIYRSRERHHGLDQKPSCSLKVTAQRLDELDCFVRQVAGRKTDF